MDKYVQALDLVIDIASSRPYVGKLGNGCRYCSTSEYAVGNSIKRPGLFHLAAVEDHKEYCLYRRAVEILEGTEDE